MTATVVGRNVWTGVILLTGLALAGCGQQKEVVVPAVVGKDAAAARSELNQLGLKVIESPQVTAGKTLGVVIDQDPKAGMKLLADETVTLMVAAGEATLTVPNVVQLSFDKARTQLEAAGLQVKRKEEQRATFEFRAGEVVSQNPAPFSPAATGAVVELEIAGPSVAVPDVQGKGLQEATAVLTAAKLLVSVGGDQSDPRQPVASTTPPAAAVVLEGTPVVLNLQVPRLLFIRAKHSNKCLHQLGATQGNGDPIAQWDCVNQANVKLEKVDAGNGSFFLKFAHSGKCVHLQGASAENGAPITQWECIGQPNLKWREEPAGDGYSYLRSVQSNKCIHQLGATQVNGGKITQWECIDQPNVQWKLEAAPQ